MGQLVVPLLLGAVAYELCDERENGYAENKSREEQMELGDYPDHVTRVEPEVLAVVRWLGSLRAGRAGKR